MPELTEIEQLIEDNIYQKSIIKATKIPERRDDMNGRWYQYGDKFKRSWTTIAGEVLRKGIGWDKWLGNASSYREAMIYADERASLGSRLHTIFANMIWGAEITTAGMEDEKIKRILEFQQFWLQAKPIPLATEYPMWSDEYPYAGTADLICDIVNAKKVKEKWLIDWKTGAMYDLDFRYQLSAYKYLAEDVFNFKIDRIGIVQFKGSHRGTCNKEDKPKYNFKEYNVIPYQEIQAILTLWDRLGIEPKLPAEFPERISLEEINNLKLKGGNYAPANTK